MYQVLQFLLIAPPILLAIIVHEVAHGWVANRCGDPTAEQMHRLTLNPLPHVDPVGTVIVPTLAFFGTGFIFGWAKPVPVNWARLRQPRRDIALVAIAGPASNLIMASCWLGLLVVAQLAAEGGTAMTLLATMARIGVIVNVVIMAVNLVPWPPLDGSRILAQVLPWRAAHVYESIGRFGVPVLMATLALTIWRFGTVPPLAWVVEQTIRIGGL